MSVRNGVQPILSQTEAEKAAVRNAILSVSPDILALQEIGGLPFLEELRADLAQEGLHYEYAIHMRADDSVRHIAVLSRIAPEVVVKHDDLDFNYIDGREKVRRGLLEVVFPFGDGGAFQLFVVHLKSHWSDVEEDPNSTLRRTREAEACRNRIVERSYDLSQDRFLIAGDFNDHPGSATLRRFYKRGELSIGARVPAADSRGEVWTLFYEKQSQYLTLTQGEARQQPQPPRVASLSRRERVPALALLVKSRCPPRSRTSEPSKSYHPQKHSTASHPS